jgi:hypothetical protein
MTDEELKNLEHSVGRHDGELDLLLKRIEELEEHLKIVIRFSTPNAVRQARQYANARGSQSPWANPPPDEPAFREKCGKFVEKYSEFESSW